MAILYEGPVTLIRADGLKIKGTAATHVRWEGHMYQWYGVIRTEDWPSLRELCDGRQPVAMEFGALSGDILIVPTAVTGVSFEADFNGAGSIDGPLVAPPLIQPGNGCSTGA
jgi:hypothetical protein